MRERKRRVYQDFSQPPADLALEVHAPQDGWRLDRFLAAQLRWRSRTAAQRLIEQGRVLRNGAPERKPARRVAAGDRIVLRVEQQPPAAPEQQQQQQAAEVPLVPLYEDPLLLVLDKPAGVICHPVGGKRRGTLIEALHRRYRHPDPGRDRVPRLCHRLDKDTSGVLVVALAPGVRRRLQWLFEGHRVVKEYLALVEGLWERDYEIVELPIGPSRGGPIRIAMEVRPDGLPARTVVCVEERFAPAPGDRGYTLVRCSPVTGRQHQIRVHLAARGHPIVGDTMYGPAGLEFAGFPPGEPVLRRHALHAWRLQMPHPLWDEELDLRAPLPADLQAALEHLRRRPHRQAD
ncbi:MAG: pseudouridine synthase [Planctomycetota bacterium]|nr:MAG: pseudouridine synthase [Planctomycetota bacterium]